MPLVDSNNKKEKKDEKSKIVFAAMEPKYSLSEMILHEKTKEEILLIIEASKNWYKVFDEWNLKSVMKYRKSILANLYGEPGTGKTMAAHAIAKELDKKILMVNYTDIESKYVGETSKNITALFEYAKENDVIIFFDEADALLSKRVTDMTHSSDVSVNQTRSVLLTILNDYEGMVLFASNFISNYDKAFMRRIQHHIEFMLPDEKLREMLWKKYVPAEMPNNLDFEEISKKFEGLSGSEISTAVLNSALKAASKEDSIVKKEYFYEEVQAILKSKNANQNRLKTTTTQKEVPREEVVRALGEETVCNAEKANIVIEK